MALPVTTEKNDAVKPVAKDLPPSKSMPIAAIQASMENDWTNASWADRAFFVRHMCESLRIPFALNPFRFIPMSVKKNGQYVKVVVMYAPAEAFSLIAKKNGISTIPLEGFGAEKTGLDTQTGIYTICIKAQDADGRSTVDFGKMHVGGQTGQNLADAQHKCMTKAKRRAIKSLVGVSVYDDDDVSWMKRNGEIDFATDIPNIIAPEPSPWAQPPTPPPVVDEETQDLKSVLFQQLIGKGGKFDGKASLAKDWVIEHAGKPFDKLDANDTNELLALLEREEWPEEKEATPAAAEEQLEFEPGASG